MVRDKVSMFPELRAVQIEVPRDVLEMLEGSGEAPAHQAGASFSTGCAHRREDPWESRATFLMEPFGALPSKVAEANLLKNMVGPCGLEPQTSTVSKLRFYNNLEDRGDCQSTRKSHKTSYTVGWSVG
jgi:hypothetical protein